MLAFVLRAPSTSSAVFDLPLSVSKKFSGQEIEMKNNCLFCDFYCLRFTSWSFALKLKEFQFNELTSSSCEVSKEPPDNFQIEAFPRV